MKHDMCKCNCPCVCYNRMVSWAWGVICGKEMGSLNSFNLRTYKNIYLIYISVFFTFLSVIKKNEKLVKWNNHITYQEKLYFLIMYLEAFSPFTFQKSLGGARRWEKESENKEITLCNSLIQINLVSITLRFLSFWGHTLLINSKVISKLYVIQNVPTHNLFCQAILTEIPISLVKKISNLQLH